MRATIGKAVLYAILALVPALMPLAAAASVPGHGAARPVSPRGERTIEERRILHVIRSRTPDQRVVERLQAKLAELDRADVRLAALLCERIDDAGQAGGADIAFTLVAALIALS